MLCMCCSIKNEAGNQKLCLKDLAESRFGSEGEVSALDSEEGPREVWLAPSQECLVTEDTSTGLAKLEQSGKQM